jgi:hypothetical protein
MKFKTLEAKARAEIRNSPEVRTLDSRKLVIAKGLAAGKFTMGQAKALKMGLRVMRQICLIQKIYELQKQQFAANAGN